MVATVLIACLVIFIIVALVVRGKKQVVIDGIPIKTSTFAMIGASVGLALLLTTAFFTMTYRLDAGEAAVIKSWTGEVHDKGVYSENGGMHFKLPWENVTTFSVRNKQLVFQPKDGDDINITASTKDNATVFIDATLGYNQDSSKVVGIYKTFHTEAEMRAQMIRDARSALQNAPTRFATMDIKQQRGALEAAYTEDLKSKLEAKYNITLTSVSVRSIWFTDEVQKSLDAVQARNAEVEQARASLEKSKINAEVTRTEAQAQADYDQIVRCGAKTIPMKEMVNGKETDGVKVVPLQGEECQNRLNEQVLTNKYIDALKELASKPGNVIITDGKTVPMVNIPGGTATAK